MKVFQRYPDPLAARKKLRARGFVADFLFDEGCLYQRKHKKRYTTDDLRIIEYHRFEGATNPSDMSIIFALEANDGVKGLITSSYGTYANMELISFLDKVKIKESTKEGNAA